ncbi:hypothetical protein JCM16358_21990 [Halanaerocella petrolearia]
MQQETIWKIKEIDQGLVTRLVEALDISSITARVLVRRGFTNPKEVKDFLDFDLTDLHNPFLLRGVKKAVARIKEAISKEEKIVVYGDYDVDGITSTSLLVDYLTQLNANVDYYIPNRLTEGYGLNLQAVEELVDAGTELLITVDCGIKAHKQIEYANEQGIDVIVTDHHTPAVENPPAVAIINPKQKECTYPWQELCGVGVAFKLAQALALELEDNSKQSPLTDYLSLVVLGTVADIVPLRGENRVIASYGLEQLNQISQVEAPGLAALVDIAGYSNKEIKAGNIGFQLAPRINAAGRLGQPEAGVEMLLAADYNRAQSLATKLNQMNNRRKEISDRIFSEAEEAIRDIDLDSERVVVLASPNWHSGVIGNVASDLQEKYYRPIILIALTEEGDGPGSCRSIPGFNIHDALVECQDLLISFGGHKQAAGFSIKKENIQQFRKRLNQYANQKLTEDDLVPRQRVDERVALKELSFALIRELDALAPFGYRNPRPVLQARSLQVQSLRAVGSNQEHLKLSVQADGQRRDGIAFNQGHLKDTLADQKVDLLFNLEENEWNGQISLQLKVKEISLPAPKLVDKLAATKESTVVAEDNDRSTALDWFYTELVEVKQEIIDKLAIREELTLVWTNSQELEVKLQTTQGQVVGYLKSKLALELAPYLAVGVNYRAFIADLKQQEIKVFITRNLNQSVEKEKGKNLDDELSAKYQQVLTALEAGEDRLVNLATEVERRLLINNFISRQVSKNQVSLIVWPDKRMVERDYRLLKEELEVYRGHAALSCQEEQTLLAGLEAGEVNILLATPEFISCYQQILNNEVDNLILATCQIPRVAKIRDSFTDVTLLATTLSSEKEGKPIEVVDKRDLTDREKLEHITDILDQGEQTLIYVSNNSKSVALTSNLWYSQEELTDQVLFYNSGLEVQDQQQVIDQFVSGQLRALVATPDFNPAVSLPGLKNIVFYQPSLTQVEFLQQISYLKQQDEATLYLLYNKQDLEKAENHLTGLAPNRELLKELYILLSKLTEGQGYIELSDKELLDRLKQRSKGLVQIETIKTGLAVFAELNLLTRSKDLESMIQLNSQPKNKLDLHSSIRYNECVVQRERFNQFKNSVLTAQLKEILNLIN